MSTLLFPGRHIVNTRFQEAYLLRHLRMPPDRLPLLGGARPAAGPIDRVVFAVTSANQSHSRYNPVPLEVRSIGVDRFARRLKESLGVGYRILPIPHFGPTGRFGEFVLKEIAEQTEGTLKLTPADTVVLSSVPDVVRQFLRLGFAVLPAELESLESGRFLELTPAEVLAKMVAAGEGWAQDAEVRRLLSPATFSVWQDFPDVPVRVFRLYRDPLLTEEGSLTETRDYGVYSVAMNSRAILEMKYRDICRFIRPGKVADEGCADGALLGPIARDFPDSDLIGIEITGEFMARCRERQRAMEFGGAYVHFHQRNITEPIFEDASIDTTICNSTTHELWSYAQQARTLRAYLAGKFRQTRRRGRVLIRDVVGPEGKDEEVYLYCNAGDGNEDDAGKTFDSPAAQATYLAALSTAGRFRRFAREFLAGARASGKRPEGDGVKYRQEVVDGRPHFVLPLRHAVEFMMKKDYLDNWSSEMNEEFTFWSFGEWKHELSAAGFRVLENPNDPEAGSRAYANPWIVENRFQGKVELYRETAGGLERMAYPVTNMVLIGERA